MSTLAPNVNTIMQFLIVAILSIVGNADGTKELNSMNQRTYGIDVSFPLQSGHVSTNYEWLPHNANPSKNPVPEEFAGVPVQPLGDRQSFFNKFMDGCAEYYDDYEDECLNDQKERIARNIRQPQSMMNFTDLGFKKVKAPQEVYDMLKKFWDENQGREEREYENRHRHTNQWEAPTYIIDLEDEGLSGGGESLTYDVGSLSKKVLEEWSGQELHTRDVYGIRKYTTGAVLATHVDRLPHVISAVINVAQEVDEPWVFELYGHDGKAYNVTMEPGEMIMYESTSVMHGRPFSLKGKYYANAFVQYDPKGGMKNGIPHYVLEGSPEADLFRHHHSLENRDYEAEEGTGANGAHYAANIGDLDTLIHIMKNERADLLHEHDANGWLPIHEAARGGHVEILEALVDHGADVNERTHWGEGQSVLNLAYEHHDEDHPIIKFLLSLGAEDKGFNLDGFFDYEEEEEL